MKKTAVFANLGNGLKLGILTFVVFGIYLKLGKEPLLKSHLYSQWNFFFSSQQWLKLFLLLVLIPVNWSLEAIKWQRLVRNIEYLTFHQALKGVLSGLTIRMAIPFGLGEITGRIWQLEALERKSALGALMVSRFTQTLATFLFGTIGFNLYIFNHFPDLFHKAFWVVVPAFCALIFFILHIVLKKGSEKLITIARFKFLSPYVDRYSQFDSKAVFEAFLFSSLRYLVFAIQFMWVLTMMEVDLQPAILFAGVTFVYLVKSLLPAFNFLSDLGIREFSALYFFSFYQVDLASVLLASLILWFFNIMIPSLVGVFYVFKMKIFNSP
ncbi:lysylphosphatidylglycerol synthase domain-containing protein [Xanthovirga aplysinae]|uniref:lysylphosphatidylglycerol synthase domain-containing protein n=1 Tax=Xanthovirga aplysinae TaxID=2529853 RepID=UPI0016570923|nr:lysylphosphatidylglycerol synthase domain-containing protein [Xanthovirga aplysinae]